MQIEFEPHKIRAAKAYIDTLVKEEFHPSKKIKKPKSKLSLFKKIIKFLFKS